MQLADLDLSKRKMRNIHLNEMLRKEIIYANNVTITSAAKLLRVTRTTLSNIVHCKSGICPEMCY